MKVLLVQSLTRNQLPVFPVGLAYIAASIRDNHDISIFDPNIHLDPWPSFADKVDHYKPDVIGISLRNLDSVEYVCLDSYYQDFLTIINIAKEKHPSAKIVVGGSAFSIYANPIMEACKDIDVGVFLEGESTFKELLANIDNPDQVEGCLIHDGQRIIDTGSRQFMQLDQITRPAYDLFQLDYYQFRMRGIGVETKRGCLCKCLYCPYPFLNGSSLRCRKPSDVVDEMQHLSESYGVRRFAFTDSVFNVPLENSVSICEELVSRDLDLKWTCYTDIGGFTEQYARLAIEAGCIAFPFSVDAFSNKALRIMGKNYTQQDILNSLEIATKVKEMEIGYGFFFDAPGTTLKDIIALVRFLLKAKRQLGSRIRKIFGINRIRIEPHTPVYDLAIEQKQITPQTSMLKPVFYSEPRLRPITLLMDLGFTIIKPILKRRRSRSYRAHFSALLRKMN